MWVRSLNPEDPLEKGMGTHSSILAWRIPWTEEIGCLQSMDLQELDMTEQLIHQKVEWIERQVETAGEEKSQSKALCPRPDVCSDRGLKCHQDLLGGNNFACGI